jgi:hypothetical protein
MANRLIDDAQHWRNRSGKMRLLADSMKSADAKAMMVRNADAYDVLADRADDQLRRSPDRQKSSTL